MKNRNIYDDRAPATTVEAAHID